MNANNAEETTTLSVSKYPELKGIEVGHELTGTWVGKVVSSNEVQVTVEFTDVKLETENLADKTLKEMTGKADQVVEDSEEDEEY